MSSRPLQKALWDSVPPIIGAVVLLTWCALFRVFRSWLLPVKAILMNMMSVGTAFGLLVMAYQWGILGWLIDLKEPPGRILVAVPLMLFCIVFGLSMDYEVFLVSRIQESWRQGSDNRQATIEGLASTGPMITSAALIMVIVFGCFALAEMVIVSMLGLGLAVAAAIDATLIRITLVPAFVMLPGRYNWLPGRPEDRGRLAPSDDTQDRSIRSRSSCGPLR